MVEALKTPIPGRSEKTTKRLNHLGLTQMLEISGRNVLFPIFLALAILPSSLAAMERHSDPDGCFSCHGLPGLEFIDEKGVRRVATILQKDYYGSLHGSVPCRDCHRKIEDYPHDPKNGYVDCSESCHLEEPSEGKPFSHQDVVKEFQKSVHGSGKKAGATDGFHGGNRLQEVENEQNPSCRRCHYNEPYIKPAQMAAFLDHFDHVDSECGVCHQGEVWRNQFSGHILRRLVGNHYSKQDANAMCIGCHGDREAMEKVEVEDPETKELKPVEKRFLFVVDSYQKMLHGRLLDVGVEDGASCLDCHAPLGVGFRHGIQRDEKSTSPTHQDHLPDTCGQSGCHAGYAHHPSSEGFLLTDVHDLDQVRVDQLMIAGVDLDTLEQSGWFTAFLILGPLSGLFLLGSLIRWGWGRQEQAIPILGGLKFQKEMLEMNPPPPAWRTYLDRWLGKPGSDSDATTELANRTDTLTILYGSQTGNGEGLAEELAELAGAWQLPFRLVNMAEFQPRQLAAESFVYIIVSTQGEGEPPITAQTLHAWLKELASKPHSGPLFPELKYAVLGLGDSSYTYFCQTGKDFDSFLEKLGAERILPRVDADVDYQEAAATWMAQVIESYSRVSGHTGVTPPPKAKPASAESYGKNRPFPAALLLNRNLNQSGSAKETRHLEINLGDSGLVYEAGDVAGIYPRNPPGYVEALLQALDQDGYLEVTVGDQTLTLREALFSQRDITTLTRPVLEKYSELCGNPELKALLENHDALEKYLWGRQILELIQDYPAPELDAQQFLACLRKIPPRLYSIASSPNAHPGQVHLTVGVVRFKTPSGRLAEGICSNYLARRRANETIPLYLQSNPHFRLPKDPQSAVIMVGPGTGIAPFRAFVEEREVSGAPGKNWLFFGEQHEKTDFLYREEWLDRLKRGVLTRLDLAFSRDQDQRIYVQHRMLEQAPELYAWLADGAYFCVCGDASRMAKDVHQALIKVVMQEGRLSQEAAMDFLKNMEQSGRYQRDVY